MLFILHLDIDRIIILIPALNQPIGLSLGTSGYMDIMDVLIFQDNG
jgi:hypothetical protein